MPNDPTGLYWLGPLAASFVIAVGAITLVVLAVVLVSPQARRNRAKLRARRQRARDLRRAGVEGAGFVMLANRSSRDVLASLHHDGILTVVEWDNVPRTTITGGAGGGGTN